MAGYADGKLDMASSTRRHMVRRMMLILNLLICGLLLCFLKKEKIPLLLVVTFMYYCSIICVI